MEINSKKLYEFSCSLGYQNEHIVKEPVLLECTHAACFGCVQDFKNNTGLKRVNCLKCNRESSLEKNYTVVEMIKNYMDISSKNIMNSLTLQYNELYGNLKSSFR